MLKEGRKEERKEGWKEERKEGRLSLVTAWTHSRLAIVITQSLIQKKCIRVYALF